MSSWPVIPFRRVVLVDAEETVPEATTLRFASTLSSGLVHPALLEYTCVGRLIARTTGDLLVRYLGIARLKGMHELNIGHSIMSRAVFVGLKQAVREMIAIMRAPGELKR